MAFKVVDKRCEKCGEVKEDTFSDEKDMCCEIEMKRIFGYRKYSEFVPGMYAHFTGEDIYLDSPEAYKKACKKYHVEQMGGRGLYERKYN